MISRQFPLSTTRVRYAAFADLVLLLDFAAVFDKVDSRLRKLCSTEKKKCTGHCDATEVSGSARQNCVELRKILPIVSRLG